MHFSNITNLLRSLQKSGFTLVELIVVVTILAILATVGFVALSGYAGDAKNSAVAANARSIFTAISAESAVTGNSPRYYVVHDSSAAMTGAVVYVDGTPVVLTWWSWNQPDTNYSAGNPDYAKLKLNPDKFRLSHFFENVFAAYDPAAIVAAAIDVSVASPNGRARIVSATQVWGVDVTGKASVAWNFSSSSGSVAGLIKASGSNSPLVDGVVSGAPVQSESSANPSAPSSPYDDGNGDPHWNSVVFLLKANPSNGTISDVKSWIPVATQGVTVDTAKNKFASANMYFPGCVNGSGNLVMTGSSLVVWTGSYTVDFWYNYVSDNNGDIINANWANQLAFPRIRGMGSKLTYYGSSGTEYAQYAHSANVWMHVAMVRDWTEKRLYVNGVRQPTILTDTINYTANTILVWRTGNYGYCVKGNIEDLRFTKAVRYSTDFTPPSAPASTFAR